ncbi:MAG: hypothetical protein HY862_00190 [Chloroflexi bacterium]|nr:hypothetical protein [Chloroflexota bacterium]
MEKHGYGIDVRKPIEFLTAMTEIFCGGSYISFEGDLSQSSFRSVEGSSTEPRGMMQRNTISPIYDFVVLPLEQDTQKVIIQTLPRIGLRSRVAHVLIERDNELKMAAYDWFYPYLVAVSGDIDANLLDRMLEAKIIRAYK